LLKIINLLKSYQQHVHNFIHDQPNQSLRVGHPRPFLGARKKMPATPQPKSNPCNLPWSMVAHLSHLVYQTDMRYTVSEKSAPTTRNTIA
jgi:hypothetical protein